MVRDDLAELVRIWEQWTDGNTLLQRALQAAERSDATLHALVDEASAYLTALAGRSTPDDAGMYAAMCAGWAVVLAIDGEGGKSDAFWRGTVNEAQEAHQDALAAREHAT